MATASRPTAPASSPETPKRTRTPRPRKPAAEPALATTPVAPAPAAAPAQPTRRARKPAVVPEQVPMPASSAPHPTLTEDQRQHCVSVAAFYIAERRGFTLGDPLQDWLEAEAEIDRLIASGHFVF